MSTTANTEVRVVTEQQLRDAISKAIRFSHAQDERLRHLHRGSAFERMHGRVSAFAISLAMDLDVFVPGLFEQFTQFQQDVTEGRNPLPRSVIAEISREREL